MSRRIFLDVGANKGQTLTAVLDPVLRFDRIFCFEPAASCWPQLRSRVLLEDRDRVTIETFGLWNKTNRALLYGVGKADMGASLWALKKHQYAEVCGFYKASKWFDSEIQKSDTVYMKLNVEGAECDILDDLLDSGEFEKVTYLMVDFDVRKIKSQKHREAELRERLKVFGFPRVAFSKQVMIGATHEERIKNWLREVGLYL